MSDVVVLTNWLDIREDTVKYAGCRDSLYVEIKSIEQLEVPMMPAERQLLRGCAAVFARLPSIAKLAADWLSCRVAICPTLSSLEMLIETPDSNRVEWILPDPRPVAVIALLHARDESIHSALQRLYKPSRKFRWNLWHHSGAATIAMARSKLLTECIVETDGDVFISWDDDMQCPPDDVEALANKALELDACVSTMVSKRVFHHGYIPLLANPIFDYPSDEVRELGEGEYAGAAINAFPRRMLERVAARLPFVHPHGMPKVAGTGAGFWPFYMDCLTEEEDGVKWLTEDRAFCDLVRGFGEKVYMYFKPRVTHFGQHGFTVIDGSMFKYNKEEINGGSEEEEGSR